MLRLQDVSKHYLLGGQVVRALEAFDLEIQTGEYVSIMGPSGSGKSTLMHLLGCLDTPTRGTYELDGVETAGLNDDRLAEIRGRKIGFVFQSFNLLPRLSAQANVSLPLSYQGVTAAERARRALDALSKVDLSHRAEHRPNELSGGERQRVAIARALVIEPAIILADEPTGNLDSKAGCQVLDLLDRLRAEGLTLVVVTHDPAVARRADRILGMVDGRIVRRIPGSELAGTDFLVNAAASSGLAP